MTRSRVGQGAGIVGAALVVSFLLLSPVAGASSVRPSVVLRAPYHGTAFSGSTNLYSTGCSKAQVLNYSHWSPANGLGGFSLRAYGHSCSPSVSGSGGLVEAMLSGGLTVQVPLPGPISGGHRVVAHWILHPLAHENLTPGVCTVSSSTSYNCDQEAWWNVAGGAYVIDLTTWATTYNSNAWGGVTNQTINYTGCSQGSCTAYGYTVQYGKLGPATFFVNSSFNRTHSYALVTYISGTAAVYLNAANTVITGASGNASLNMASSFRYADLVSVALT